jgi:hypothetical protein
MRVARGMSPFITKVGTSLIPSPITKARASPFIMKADASPIPNIDTHTLQMNVSIPFPARAEQWRCPICPVLVLFLPLLSLFGGAL